MPCPSNRARLLTAAAAADVGANAICNLKLNCNCKASRLQPSGSKSRLRLTWLPSSTTAVLLCCMLFVVFSPELSYAEEEEYPQLPGMPGNETWPAPYVESGQGLGVFSCPCIDTKNYTAPYVKPTGPCGKRLDFTNDPQTGCLDTNYGSGEQAALNLNLI